MRVQRRSAFFRISLFATSHQTRVTGARARRFSSYRPKGESGQGVGPVARGSPNLRLAFQAVNMDGRELHHTPRGVTAGAGGAWGTGWEASRYACLRGPGRRGRAVVCS